MSFVVGCTSLKIVNVPAVATKDDWAQFGGSGERTNATEESIRLPLQQCWEYGNEAGFSAFSAVAEGPYALAGDMKGILHVIDVESGRGKDVRDFGSTLHAPPVIDGRMVYLALPDDDENLVAYDLADNGIVWRLRTGGIETSPLLIGSMLYVVTREGELLAVDRVTGAVRWTYLDTDPRFRGQCHASPAGNDSVIVFGRDNGTLTAVNRLAGTVRWRVKPSGSQVASPAISGQTIYIGAADSSFSALDLMTGATLWKRTIGGRIFAGAAVGRSAVYLGTASGLLLALDAATGTTLWSHAAKNGYGASPLLAGDLLIAGNLDKTVTTFNARTGGQLWQWTGEGRVKSTPILHRGTLVIPLDNRSVVAFRAAGDSSHTSSPPIGDRNR